MKEYLELLFGLQNVIPTALFLFSVAYWLTVMLGMFDLDALDIDIDADIEMDVETDVNQTGNASADISWLNNILIFFNISKVPFMVWFTFLSFTTWFITSFINASFGIDSFIGGFIVFIPVFILGLFLAKFCTIPFAKIFAKMDEDTKPKTILGKTAVVKIAPMQGKKGQAELNYEGVFLNLYILPKNPKADIAKGSTVEFVKKHEDDNTYLVEPYYEI